MVGLFVLLWVPWLYADVRIWSRTTHACVLHRAERMTQYAAAPHGILSRERTRARLWRERGHVGARGNESCPSPAGPRACQESISVDRSDLRDLDALPLQKANGMPAATVAQPCHTQSMWCHDSAVIIDVSAPAESLAPLPS